MNAADAILQLIFLIGLRSRLCVVQLLTKPVFKIFASKIFQNRLSCKQYKIIEKGASVVKKALGILGGMGPLATANFMTQVVESTEAQKDQDHLRIYVDCNSQIPARLPPLMGTAGDDPSPAMCESIKKLESIGAEIIAMPCVTAHAFYNKIIGAASVPFLYMPEIVAKACLNNFPKKTAGVLSTVGTAKFRILLDPMGELNVPCIEPSAAEQDEINRLIDEVKVGGDMTKTAADFSKVLDAMIERGVDYFVLGCTELPIIGNYCNEKYVLVDTTLELARAAVAACGGTVKNG